VGFGYGLRESGEPWSFFSYYIGLSGGLFLILLSGRSWLTAWQSRQTMLFLQNGALILITATFAGTTLGAYVRDHFKTRHHVLLKDERRLEDAKPILILSHHSTYLLGGDVIVTVPAAEIQRVTILKRKPEIVPK
jgi:hypothetical protein